MKVFMTGASGFIGSAIIPQLIRAGHQVVGLARSDEAAAAVAVLGAEVHRGSLEDFESLHSGASESDGVIHAGFVHDFARFAEVCELDARVIETLGTALEGSDRPLVITSGTGMGSPDHGQLATEDVFNPNHPNPRKASEIAGMELLEKGVNVLVVRLPQVHDQYKQGLISPLIAVALESQVSAYVGDGLNRWPACPRQDAALVYKLAIEKGVRGARYHAVAEEGVTAKEIAESLGRRLSLPVVTISPEEAAAHFGWMGMFVGLDMPASSKLTREWLGWNPIGPTLISDLDSLRTNVP